MLKHLGSPLRVPTLDTTPTQSPASEAKLSDKKYSKRQEWNPFVQDLSKFTLSPQQLRQRNELFKKYAPHSNSDIAATTTTSHSPITYAQPKGISQSPSVETLKEEIDFEREVAQFRDLNLGVFAATKPVKSTAKAVESKQQTLKLEKKEIKRLTKSDLTKVGARTDSGLKKSSREFEAEEWSREDDEAEKKPSISAVLESFSVGLRHLNSSLVVPYHEEAETNSTSRDKQLLHNVTETILGLTRVVREYSQRINTLEGENRELTTRLFASESSIKTLQSNALMQSIQVTQIETNLARSTQKQSDDIANLYEVIETQTMRDVLESINEKPSSEADASKRMGLIGRFQGLLWGQGQGDIEPDHTEEDDSLEY